MKGFCYTEKDRVVVNQEEKPDPEHFFDVHMPGILDDIIQDTESYKKYLSAWDDSCMTIDSIQYEWNEGEVVINIGYGKNNNFNTGWQTLSNGQPVHFDITGEKTAKITSINN